ncbi:MAG: cell envelope integrity protein TolA [Pseudomonadota bacterium]
MAALMRTAGVRLQDRRGEPKALLAGVLAVLVHLLAVVALTYGFHIQTQRNEPVSAELWAALPPSPAAERPPPKDEPVDPVPAPKPVPRPEPKPVPKPPPEPKEAPAKALPKVDIELKAKEAAKAKQAEEDRRKLEEAKKREAEKAQAEAKAQKEALAKQTEADRIRREQEELSRRAAEAAASAQAKLLASHVDKIRGKVRRFIVEPPGVAPNATAEFDVVLIPGGDVLSVKLRRSSGNALYDEAVERAIMRAQPLPIPPEPQLFPQFRMLLLQFRPQE